METQQIAQTIRSQIGMRNLMFLGANKFMALSNDGIYRGGLQFNCSGTKLLRGGKCLVKLNGYDEYEITIGTVRGTKWTVKHKVDGVHCEQLAEMIIHLVW